MKNKNISIDSFHFQFFPEINPNHIYNNARDKNGQLIKHFKFHTNISLELSYTESKNQDTPYAYNLFKIDVLS